MTVHAVTDATFEAEVLQSELPVLVDLYADWCQPCKQLSPIVAQVADELAGKIKVVKVDVDANPMIAQTFRAQSIPMLLTSSRARNRSLLFSAGYARQRRFSSRWALDVMPARMTALSATPAT